MSPLSFPVSVQDAMRGRDARASKLTARAFTLTATAAMMCFRAFVRSIAPSAERVRSRIQWPNRGHVRRAPSA